MTPDPHLSERALNLIEFAAKFAVGLGSMKVFLAGIWKPFAEWRKEHRASTIRAVLEPELKQLQEIINTESGCADNMKLAVESIKQVFAELDAFMGIVTDNRERINETNELLDEVFHLDRRQDHDREAQIDSLLIMLAGRRQLRARNIEAMQAATDELRKP